MSLAHLNVRIKSSHHQDYNTEIALLLNIMLILINLCAMLEARLEVSTYQTSKRACKKRNNGCQ